MGFQSFQQLPQHNLDVPAVHAPATVQPPVYDTSQTIHQLQTLAEYFSPMARAQRKAAVAKANYEYRLYTSNNPMLLKDPLFYYKRNLLAARAAALNKKTAGTVDKEGAAVSKLPGFGITQSNPSNLPQDQIDEAAERVEADNIALEPTE